MKDCKNTSSGDVSSTSRTSQSQQTHLKLLGGLPLQALVSADLHTTKSLKLSGTWTFLSLESLTCRSFFRKWPKSPSKSDFKLK
ncbi:hypothetical protein GmHk_13G036333 [Glycine max]|nr:hypothetical protein GmHk_13G036333 [Glycine max]